MEDKTYMRYHLTKDGNLLVMVAENNELLWPNNTIPGEWYGKAEDCPYPVHEFLKKDRRRLENHLRHNDKLLVKCLEVAEKEGFPFGF